MLSRVEYFSGATPASVDTSRLDDDAHELDEANQDSDSAESDESDEDDSDESEESDEHHETSEADEGIQADQDTSSTRRTKPTPRPHPPKTLTAWSEAAGFRAGRPRGDRPAPRRPRRDGLFRSRLRRGLVRVERS